ncbi:hypothetical protein Hte_008630 [Hypoxylon texense]
MWLFARLVGFVFRRARMGYILSSRRPAFLPASTLFLYGYGAGLLGVAATTATEKLELYLTSRPGPRPGPRPSPYVPGRGRQQPQLSTLLLAAAAVLRAWMSYRGVRGPLGGLVFVGARLLVDGTLEDWTRVGAPPPWTWPVNEQVLDILHKTVFALVTGYFTDRWIQ